MKKKEIQEIRQKTKNVLFKESIVIRGEIAKLILEARANAPKDTNSLAKKKKKLAVMLTILKDLK